MAKQNVQSINITNFFPYSKGVQQGNPLSPILLNLYINDIFETIRNNNPVSLDGNSNFNALMYADDLIIISTTKQGLQDSLNSLQNIKKLKQLKQRPSAWKNSQF